ncbi:glycosyltransferase family 1 protein [Xylariales sp. PMI_506]|nr:glycosyltransferase family 1 protein [Xylariales sp. PMI_506]
MASSTTGEMNGKPVVVMIAFPAPGHSQGTIQMSEYLVKQGYKVYHIGGTAFKEQIERGGAEFIENDYDLNPGFQKVLGTVGPDALISAMKYLFWDIIPKAYELLKNTLEVARESHPSQDVVIWHECMAGGLLPFYYGLPLPRGYDKLPRVVNFQSSINTSRSDEVFPFGMGQPLASSDQERAACKAAWEGFDALLAPVNEHINGILKSLGATEEMTGNMFDRIMAIGDITVFPYSASLEFPRAKLNFNAKFVGTFAKPTKPAQTYPPWWAEIEANSSLPADSRKKIVFVSQGTAHLNYTDLLIPTLQVLSSQTNVITIAVLGMKGATLPNDFSVPANARVIDYFPYEAVLPYADAFVSNAGFGGFLHGVMSGVPMVVAGTEADKADVCQRAEYAGMAINLRTQQPTEESLREGITKILEEPKYRARAIELKEENTALNGLGSAEKCILGIVE